MFGIETIGIETIFKALYSYIYFSWPGGGGKY